MADIPQDDANPARRVLDYAKPGRFGLKPVAPKVDFIQSNSSMMAIVLAWVAAMPTFLVAFYVFGNCLMSSRSAPADSIAPLIFMFSASFGVLALIGAVLGLIHDGRTGTYSWWAVMVVAATWSLDALMIVCIQW